MSDLPAGWTMGSIADLVEVGPKNDCDDSTMVGFVPMNRMGRGFREIPTFEVRKWSDVKKGYTHFADGDVLLARITPCFENGKAGIPRGLPNGLGAGSTEYVVLRPKEGVATAEFVLARLRTEDFMRKGARAMTGAVGQQRVPKDVFESYPIPIAPFPEQLRISRKIKTLLATVDSCRERLNRVPQILKKFREAVLEAAVSGRLTEDWRQTSTPGISGRDLATLALSEHQSHRRMPINTQKPLAGIRNNLELIRQTPESWGLLTGADAVAPGADIVYGIVQPGPKLSAGVRYVRGMDIENGQILIDQLMMTSSAIAAKYERASLRGGDVLLGIIRATKVAVVPDELTGANITQGTARFRPSSVIRTKYLARVLEAPLTQKWLHDRYRGIDMPGLNLADVRLVPIPLPSIEEQEAIIRRVDGMLAIADQLQRRHAEATSHVENLTPSILAKAFRGELVPQDPIDEPAEEILERMRVAGSTGGASTKKIREVGGRRR